MEGVAASTAVALTRRHSRHHSPHFQKRTLQPKGFQLSLGWLRPFSLLFVWGIAQFVDLLDLILLCDGLARFTSRIIKRAYRCQVPWKFEEEIVISL
jgi:hypothetical protein